MHLDEKSTQLSRTATLGIKELGQNELLVCNNCVTPKKRDKLIENASKIQQQAPIEDKKFKSLQPEMNDTKKAITDLKVSRKIQVNLLKHLRQSSRQQTPQRNLTGWEYEVLRKVTLRVLEKETRKIWVK